MKIFHLGYRKVRSAWILQLDRYMAFKSVHRNIPTIYTISGFLSLSLDDFSIENSVHNSVGHELFGVQYVQTEKRRYFNFNDVAVHTNWTCF